jgi:tetratricopeptide (TPR) repeat protein
LDVARNEPAAWRDDHRIAETEILLAEFLAARGRYAEAESLLLPRALGREPPGTFDETKIRARVQLGIVRRCRADWAGAESLLVQAVAMVERFPGFRAELVASRHELGKVLAAMGRSAEAESIHARAIVDADSAPESRNILRAIALRGVGELRVDEGRPREAETLFRESLDCLALEANPNELEIALTRLGLAMALMEEEPPLSAERELRLVMSELDRAGWSREWPAAVAANELACCLALTGREKAMADRLWNDSRQALLAASTPVPHSLRWRAVSHTIRAMSSTGEKRVAEYTLAMQKDTAIPR